MLKFTVLPQFWLGESVRPHDCEADGPRYCLREDCRFHLLDGRGNGRRVSEGGRSIDPNRPPGRAPNTPRGVESRETIPESCAIDVAEDGPQTRGRVGMLMGLSGERVRHIEAKAVAKIKALHAGSQGARDEYPWRR